MTEEQQIIEALKKLKNKEHPSVISTSSVNETLNSIATLVNEIGVAFGDELYCKQVLDSIEEYAIFTISPDAVVLSWNKGTERMVGVEAAKAIGRTAVDFYTRQDVRKNEPFHSMALAREKGQHETETRGKRPDGSLFWASVIYTPLYARDQSLLGYSIIARDITALKQAKYREQVSLNQLKETESRFKLVVDSVKDYAIFMISPQGVIQGWNKGAELIKGYIASEIIGKHISVFYPEEDVAKGEPMHNLKMALQEGRYESEGWRVRKDGSHFWADVVYTPLYDENHELKGFSKITRDMTQLKKQHDDLQHSLDRLKESESKFKLVVDTVKDYAIFMISPQGIIQGWNKGAELIKGYKSEEIIGRHISIFYTEEDNINGEPMKNLEIARNKGRFESEGWRVKKDGSLFWADVIYTPLYDENKTLKGFSKITRDMTIQRNEQQKLKELSAAMSLRANILQGISNLNDILKVEKSIDTLSIEIIQFICKTVNAVIGGLYVTTQSKNALEYSAGFSFDSSREMSAIPFGRGLLGQVAVTQEPYILEEVPDGYMMISSGFGEIKPKTIYIIPLLFEGKTQGVMELGFIVEITPEKKEFLDLVSENIGAAFYSSVARSDMISLVADIQQKSDMLELQKYQLEQRNEDLKVKTEELLASEEELRGQQEELMQTNALMEEKAQKLEEHTEALAVKNKELEIARKEMLDKTAQLEQSSRYKSEFLANMSHELRTPLNSIILLSKLLSERQGEVLDGKLAEYAMVIRKSGKDLLGLINDILDLSKIEAGKLELDIRSMSLGGLVNDMTELFEPVAQSKNIYLKTSLGEGLPESVLMDKVRVSQVLKNLLSNAMKFTETGGVTLSIYRENDMSAFSQKLKVLADGYLCFEVRDTGIGISNDKKEHIFEAFSQEDGTTSRKYGGTGLGLSISKELAQLMGGFVSLKSEVGKGSSFILVAPLNASPDDKQIMQPKVLSKPEVAPVERSNKPKLILIIEDDAQMAKALAKQVEGKGFRCVVCETAEEGFAEMHEETPSGILLDIHLPGMNGWELLRRIKDNPLLSHVPVHVMSGVTHSPSGEQQELADGFIKKPATLENLDVFYKSIENIPIQEEHKILFAADKAKAEAILPVLDELSAATTLVSAHEEILEKLVTDDYDLLILDYSLLGTDTVKVVKSLKTNNAWKHMHFFIICGQDLSSEEYGLLDELSVTIIVNSGKFEHRILDEAALFLNALHKGQIDNYEQLDRVKLPIPKDDLRGRTVLITDDDSRNIFSLSESLSGNEINIITAANGKQALEKIQEHPEIDIVLMDIMMPEMDGYEAIEKIRKELKKKELPIIALTAKAMKADAERAIAAGANDYHSKPVDIEKLVQLMQVMLNRR